MSFVVVVIVPGRRPPGINMCMGSANEKRRHNVTLYLIGQAHTQNDSWTTDDYNTRTWHEVRTKQFPVWHWKPRVVMMPTFSSLAESGLSLWQPPVQPVKAKLALPVSNSERADLNVVWTDQSIQFNSSPPSAAYMRQWIGSTLVQIMACRLFGAKSLSKPVLGYCQLDP